jgi:hypothetical protein
MILIPLFVWRRQIFALVPTLCVGTHVWDALRPVLSGAATQSVAHLRSHAERGNEGK